MTPNQVREKWPREAALAEDSLNKTGSALEAIAKMRQETGISLPDAKRVILAVQCNISLEEHEEKLIPAIEEAFDSMETENPQ